MKKGLLFVALFLAAAGGAWYLYQHPGTEAPTASRPAEPAVAAKPSAADYVPADTAIFFGSLKPVQFAEYARFLEAYTHESVDMVALQTELRKSLARIAGAGGEPPQALRMILGLYAEYLARMSETGGLSPIGLADPLDSAFYLQDALPVLRIRLGDEAAFDAFIARAAARFGAKAEPGVFDGLSYQRYALTPAGAAKRSWLVVARHRGYGILTLDLGDLVPPQTFSRALGQTRPHESLAASGKLERISRADGLLPAWIGFIDHAGLLRALTSPDDPLAQLLDQLSDDTTKRDLAAYRTPGCRRDLEAMAALWPRTVFGYTRLDLQSSPRVVGTLMKIESTDAPLMKTLMALRGFVPTYDGGGAGKIELKLGLNVDELGPTLTQLWTRASTAKFTCEPLLAAQQGMRASSPVALGAMTGMIRGLRGIGLSIQEIELGPSSATGPEIDRVDALVSISSEHPEQLWGLLTLFNPSLAALPLPADGQTIDLPLPIKPGIPRGLKLGHYGSHLVLFSGDRAAVAARSLARQPLASNGLYELHLDYGLFADLLAATPDTVLAGAGPAPTDEKSQGAGGATATGAAVQPNAQSLAALRKQIERLRGIRVDMRLDFVQDGVTIGGRIEIPKHG